MQGKKSTGFKVNKEYFFQLLPGGNLKFLFFITSDYF